MANSNVFCDPVCLAFYRCLVNYAHTSQPASHLVSRKPDCLNSFYCRPHLFPFLSLLASSPLNCPLDGQLVDLEECLCSAPPYPSVHLGKATFLLQACHSVVSFRKAGLFLMILCPSCICVPFWLSCGPRPVCLCIVTRALVRFLSSHPINKYTVFCSESMFSGPKIEMNQYHTYLGGMPSEISLSSIVLSNQCQSQLKTWYTSVFLWFVMMDFQYCELRDYV